MMFRTVTKFIQLAPGHAVVLFTCSIVTGVLEAIVAFSFVPLIRLFRPVSDLEIGDSPFLKVLEVFESFGWWEDLSSIFIFIFALYVIVAVVNFSIQVYSSWVSESLVKRLSDEIMGATFSATWKYFSENRPGVFINSTLRETRMIAKGYYGATLLVSGACRAVVLLVMASMISALTTLYALGAGIVVLWCFRVWIRHSVVAQREINNLNKSVSTKITEGLGGFKALKVMGLEGSWLQKLSADIDRMKSQQLKNYVVLAIPNNFREPAIILLLGLGVYASLTLNFLPIDYLAPLTLLCLRSAHGISSVQTLYQKVKSLEPYHESLSASLLEVKQRKEQVNGKYLATFNYSITLDKVTLAYGEKLVLDRLFLSIDKNKFTVLLGPSGVGKTTITDLLSGLCMPDAGSVKIDGIDLKAIDIMDWRKKIGYVPQELILFHDTVFRNVTVGSSEYRVDDVKEALVAAGAWEFVNELPHGINSIVGEQGLRLSGGQRQRLSIARALVRKPELLILDEATTSLDPVTESGILSSLKKLTEHGVTIFAVSHQPEVFKVADEIYKLENREIKKANHG
jgi:ATP-binding cassette, subfamily C, bacterial